MAVDLRAIQESLGFYVIVNHGVPQELIDRAFEQVAQLFALPLDTKMNYRVDYHHIGYIPDKATVLRWSKIAKLKEEMARLEAFEIERLAAPDQQISLTDPDARSMATSGRGSGMVGYNVQAAVDTIASPLTERMYGGEAMVSTNAGMSALGQKRTKHQP